MDWRLGAREKKTRRQGDRYTSKRGIPPCPLVLPFLSTVLGKNMPITQTEVEKIAGLANLELTGEEKVSLSSQLAAIVEYIDQLNELDTSTVKPWQQQGAGEVVDSYATREDIVEPGLGQNKALDQAPDHDDGSFLVPRVIGG
jgi:aspartyl-tRNA(Asn)/glutamyl-tRNA(Gln) amidotransferase subunit C